VTAITATKEEGDEDMAEAKLIVLYPQPADAELFEKAFSQEHLPALAGALEGMATRTAISNILGGLEPSPYALMSEIYFPSQADLQAFIGSENGKAAAAQAIAISNGGQPLFLVSDETVPGA
jgi:uncharacterized protein (TIGR02118 family)